MLTCLRRIKVFWDGLCLLSHGLVSLCTSSAVFGKRCSVETSLLHPIPQAQIRTTVHGFSCASPVGYWQKGGKSDWLPSIDSNHD